MSATTTRRPPLPPNGTDVFVSTDDGWSTSGTLVGLTRDDDGAQMIVKGYDGLDRHVKIKGATVTVQS